MNHGSHYAPSRSPLAATGAEQDLTVSGEVSARLFSSYMDNIHPIWPILYMPMYDHGRLSAGRPSLTPSVLYAVYAIAACIEGSRIDESSHRSLYEPSPALLFESALLAMQRVRNEESPLLGQFHPLNMLRPSIESCQALTILALQQHGLGEASNAAVLCSIASGMAIDLRLNESQPEGSDPQNIEVASRLWWNLFVLDKMLESERGRPFRLHAEDASTPRPSAAESDEYQLIKVPHAATGRSVTIKTYGLSAFEKTIELATMMESIGREVCSVNSRNRIREDLNAAEVTRISLCRKLDNYSQSLEQSNMALWTTDGFRAAVPPAAIINTIVSNPDLRNESLLILVVDMGIYDRAESAFHSTLDGITVEAAEQPRH